MRHKKYMKKWSHNPAMSLCADTTIAELFAVLLFGICSPAFVPAVALRTDPHR